MAEHTFQNWSSFRKALNYGLTFAVTIIIFTQCAASIRGEYAYRADKTTDFPFRQSSGRS